MSRSLIWIIKRHNEHVVTKNVHHSSVTDRVTATKVIRCFHKLQQRKEIVWFISVNTSGGYCASLTGSRPDSLHAKMEMSIIFQNKITQLYELITACVCAVKYIPAPSLIPRRCHENIQNQSVIIYKQPNVTIYHIIYILSSLAVKVERKDKWEELKCKSRRIQTCCCCCCCCWCVLSIDSTSVFRLSEVAGFVQMLLCLHLLAVDCNCTTTKTH